MLGLTVCIVCIKLTRQRLLYDHVKRSIPGRDSLFSLPTYNLHYHSCPVSLSSFLFWMLSLFHFEPWLRMLQTYIAVFSINTWYLLHLHQSRINVSVQVFLSLSSFFDFENVTETMFSYLFPYSFILAAPC